MQASKIRVESVHTSFRSDQAFDSNNELKDWMEGAQWLAGQLA
jgi:hypothetical protein